MIEAVITTTDGQFCAFTVKNHGGSYVCGAVSMLVLNTVNCIEALTNQDFDCDYETQGGYIRFALKGPRGEEAGLLLDAMLFGLRDVQKQYPNEINLKEM